MEAIVMDRKSHFGAVVLGMSMGLALLLIYLAEFHFHPPLPKEAVWGSLSSLGTVLLIVPCFLAGLYLGQLLAVLLYWPNPAHWGQIRRFFSHLGPVFGKTNAFRRDLSFSEMAGKELLAFFKVLALFLAVGYVGARDVYYLAPDGAHFSSIVKGDRAYPWGALRSVAVRCEQSHRGSVLTCWLTLQDGSQADLVQGNPDGFRQALPSLRHFLAQERGVEYSSRIDARSQALVQAVFGTGDPARFFST
ncbi:MAG TPA: hypothetical protein VK842_07870 [bacterium]|nr:hypothetical protein [bacterium]